MTNAWGLVLFIEIQPIRALLIRVSSINKKFFVVMSHFRSFLHNFFISFLSFHSKSLCSNIYSCEWLKDCPKIFREPLILIRGPKFVVWSSGDPFFLSYVDSFHSLKIFNSFWLMVGVFWFWFFDFWVQKKAVLIRIMAESAQSGHMTTFICTQKSIWYFKFCGSGSNW